MTKTIKIYTDGSWSSKKKSVAGWSYVAIVDNQVVHQENGRASGDSQQVGGELKAVMAGLLWCYENGYEHVEIHYDYTGVRHWALREWKAKKDLPKKYVSFVSTLMKVLHVKFIKVDAHTGNQWNELADELAKKAIRL